MPIVRIIDLSERVNQAFDQVDKDSADQYLSELRENWRDTSSALSRVNVLIVLLIGVFGLLAYASIEKIQVGPVELGNTDLIRKLLPIVLFYLYYEQALLSVRWVDADDIHRAIVKKFYPTIYQFDFEAALVPRGSPLLNLATRSSPASGSAIHNFVEPMHAFFMTVVTLLPGFFGIVAFLQLFQESDHRDIVIWGSAVISAGFFLLGMITWILLIRTRVR